CIYLNLMILIKIIRGFISAEHPDLVNRDNHTRNILRTSANSKLRMEDRRGEEHIKLATEYGKTQLNSGHLVDSQGQLRGKGTELRT
ncbi:type VI secretion system Vgr family protein, partial [Escherichia sp. 79.0191]|uniref:type VI secretion system Vgr family protein n=1 Tax=Escherichia sp. 79.0191 TaxID=2730947 RepID=UPI001601EE2F